MSDARALTDVLAQVDAAAGLPTLVALWQAHDPAAWQDEPEAFRRLGTRALKLGGALFAHDVVCAGLQQWPADVRLRQLQALALTRSGARVRATQLLTRLVEEGHSDEETLGMLARTHKDFWLAAHDEETRARELRLARDAYLKAYELSRGYWTAINAATLSLLMDEPEQAQALAREVRAACLQELAGTARTYGDSYWPLATLGEAALLLGDYEEATARYCAAAALGNYGEIASTRRNARLLIAYLQLDGADIEACLRLPRVVVCAGHMIDRPGRTPPRFPAHLEAAVRAALRARLETHGAGIGYSSAACGTDIIFLEVMHELGGETNVVLPYNREQFIEDSVDVVPGWRERFEVVLERATSVVVASEQKIGVGGLSYEYCNLLIEGLGGIHAEQLETELVPLAIWDGRAGDGPGGTASYVAQWRASGHEIEVIDPLSLRDTATPAWHVVRAGDGQHTPATQPAAGAPTDARAEFKPQLKALLFADAVHFSKLTEGQIPLFLGQFLEPIAQLLARPDYAPDGKNTWGDGLYFVFDTVRRAGLFALALAEQLNRTDFAAKGLPPGLNLRIALHAGPVYACVDPVTERETFTGTHVSRAARIEPITPPGQVYASQAFAALAYAQGMREFTCEYVGQTPLAKGYGTFPTYLVRRRAA
jgi:class 3 adenylate cyclase/tetratricopeptide (TPR) repeat protein